MLGSDSQLANVFTLYVQPVPQRLHFCATNECKAEILMNAVLGQYFFCCVREWQMPEVVTKSGHSNDALPVGVIK
jgi:hypothetical protein